MRCPTPVFLVGLLIPAVLAAYDQNRAGAVLKAPEGDSFTSVSGTFTVPNLSGANKLSIWVAIGDTLEQDIVLKGGVTFSQSWTSFSAWYPDNETDVTSEVPVRASDRVTVTVSLPSDNKETGTVIVENTTQNQRSTMEIPMPAAAEDASALTSLAADWFVQAYQTAGELVQVPRFGSVSFTQCSATLASGETVGPQGAGVFEIQGTSGQIYSRTTATASGVTVQQQSGFGFGRRDRLA